LTKQRAYDRIVDPPKDHLVTPYLWLLIGAGLGVGTLEVVGFPLLVGCVAGLTFRAARSPSTRQWADLAGLLFGAGVASEIFLVPGSLTASCSGTSGSGGCDPSGHCWSTGPTSCTDSHVVLVIAAAVACLFVLCAVAIFARLGVHASRSRTDMASSRHS
jgi:hypothetical protein